LELKVLRAAVDQLRVSARILRGDGNETCAARNEDAAETLAALLAKREGGR
jgi:hypothetical protein